jgi:hypothetical protein
VHFPGAGPEKYFYTVYACYFKADGTVDLDQSIKVEADLSCNASSELELGFTRGYISSQAYADPVVADFYEQAFKQAFKNVKGFKSSNIVSKWFDATTNKNPAMSLSFAPHKAAFSLNTVSDVIDWAKSSVFFALLY